MFRLETRESIKRKKPGEDGETLVVRVRPRLVTPCEVHEKALRVRLRRAWPLRRGRPRPRRIPPFNG